MAGRLKPHAPRQQDPMEPLSPAQMIIARNLYRFGGKTQAQIVEHFRRAPSVIRAQWPDIIYDKRLTPELRPRAAPVTGQGVTVDHRKV